MHIINIKPSSTPQSLISPGLYAQTVSPTLPLPNSPPSLSPSFTHSLSGSPLAPSSFTVPVSFLSPPPRWLTCKAFLSHVARNGKSLPHRTASCQAMAFSICPEHGCWCCGKEWDVGLQPGCVSLLFLDLKCLTFNGNLFCFVCLQMSGKLHRSEQISLCVLRTY